MCNNQESGIIVIGQNKDIHAEEKTKVTIEWPNGVIQTYTLNTPTGHFSLEVKHPAIGYYCVIKDLENNA